MGKGAEAYRNACFNFNIFLSKRRGEDTVNGRRTEYDWLTDENSEEVAGK